jgi:hypothetical protein
MTVEHNREPAPSREQLLYLLHEASEIEHNLMCCYLYAAFSLKVADARWSPRQAEAVARFRRVLTSVALEEMTHLCNVANLVASLGGLPHFGRPNLPVDAGPIPLASSSGSRRSRARPSSTSSSSSGRTASTSRMARGSSPRGSTAAHLVR